MAGSGGTLHGGLHAPGLAGAHLLERLVALGHHMKIPVRGFNVLNLSHGMVARKGYTANQIGCSAQERSIITDAAKGLTASRGSVRKVAGDLVSIGHVAQHGRFGPAARLGARATGVKMAAWRGLNRIGHDALEHNPLALNRRVRDGYR